MDIIAFQHKDRIITHSIEIKFVYYNSQIDDIVSTREGLKAENSKLSHGFAVFLSQASVFNKILSKIFIEIDLLFIIQIVKIKAHSQAFVF